MKVACLQVCAGDDMDHNLAAAADGIREAASAGADFITTPENVALMATNRDQLLSHAVDERQHPAVARFAALAAEVNRWILAGSIGVATGDGRIFNRSLLFGPDGRIAARYDKIHMFDVDLPGGEVYHESRNYRPGSAAVVTTLPWTRLGMTVCYDVRFPSLFRALGQLDAQVITVPSAFTKVTGRAHWSVLLRARAIETGAFVVAPAQVGRHPAKRETYGHSMVVGPWGEVLLDAGEAPGVYYADIDLAKVAAARAAIPAWTTSSGFALPGA
ncbi:MAG: carbon-nitrogen hydrolase family protein [Proteobacteria bacterium]|nr:carbon-nitrogen hydrolase family protein [Pseudomonadota bacterium]MDA1057481.1 carbon-nitrogen hydrolase family protein [Pseudomonadota bacterium]